MKPGDQRKLDETLIDAGDVSRLLKCSVPLIYKMAERGQVPCIRWRCLGDGTKRTRTMLRFKVKDILDFIEKNYRTT